jgi:hypothetical protein
MKTRNGSTKFLIIPDGKLEPDLPFVSPAVIRKLDNGKWAVDVVVNTNPLGLTNDLNDMDRIEVEEGDEEFDSPEEAFNSLMAAQHG